LILAGRLAQLGSVVTSNCFEHCCLLGPCQAGSPLRGQATKAAAYGTHKVAKRSYFACHSELLSLTENATAPAELWVQKAPHAKQMSDHSCTVHRTLLHSANLNSPPIFTFSFFLPVSSFVSF
jgi:hypothetical protein